MGRVARALMLAALAACGAPREAPLSVASLGTFPEADTFLLVNARTLDGAPLTLAVRAGMLVEEDALPPDAPRVDAAEAVVVPAFVDAHVHFAYAPLEERHAAGGVAVAVDLGAPIATLHAPIEERLLVLRAGPMITRPSGYPLDSWGHADASGEGGYGLGCDDEAACIARVDELVDAGADVIKVAVLPGTLEGALLGAVVARAHARGRIVLAHALTDREALRAGTAGVDVLAHTPVEALSQETIAAFADRAVISTLGAFGSRVALENLRRLREAGATILYGTDLGNTRTAGIDPREIGLLAEAGLDTAAIVEAATSAPARIFGLARHGSLAPGHAASFLLYRTPTPLGSSSLARPDVVVLDGRRR